MAPARQVGWPAGLMHRRVPSACACPAETPAGKSYGCPAGGCACVEVCASGNMAAYEQRADDGTAGPQSRRPAVQGRSGEPDGARAALAEGAVRLGRRCPRAVAIGPHGGDTRHAVHRRGGRGADVEERVTGQTSGSPLCRPKLRGRPDVNFGSCQGPSARREPSGRSWRNYCSRSRFCCAILSSWRVRGSRTAAAAAPSESGRILRQPHPLIPLRARWDAGIRAIDLPG